MNEKSKNSSWKVIFIHFHMHSAWVIKLKLVKLLVQYVER